MRSAEGGTHPRGGQGLLRGKALFATCSPSCLRLAGTTAFLPSPVLLLLSSLTRNPASSAFLHIPDSSRSHEALRPSAADWVPGRRQPVLNHPDCIAIKAIERPPSQCVCILSVLFLKHKTENRALRNNHRRPRPLWSWAVRIAGLRDRLRHFRRQHLSLLTAELFLPHPYYLCPEL